MPTAAETHKRNMEIVTAKARGLSAEVLATTFGIGARRVHQIVAEYRATMPSLRQHDPTEVVDDMLWGYQAAIEELALIASTTNSDTVKVQAVSKRTEVQEKVIALLQQLGHVPQDLGELRIISDLDALADRVAKVLDDYGVADNVRDALIAALEGREVPLPE